MVSSSHGVAPTAEHWSRAARALAAKMLAELSFEGALHPLPAAVGWRVEVGPPVSYIFRGRRTAMGGWRLDPDSVRRVAADADADAVTGAAPADPFRLLIDLYTALGLDPAVTALTVQELTATLSADAHLLATGASVAELADMAYAELEGHQGGHPWIFANKGRVGFSAADRAAYAPEARRPLGLPWIAVHRGLATYHGVPGLSPERLLERELDADTRARFAARLRDQLAAGQDEYVWLPVHPWQWDEIVVPLFAGELAAGRIVGLGVAPDTYLPQGSIRTFTNVDRPQRCNVKVSLSILNTMVYRGIPTELARVAPPTTTWMHGLLAGDRFLSEECRLILLGEVAAVAVPHPVLEDMPDVPYRYRQLLGALWREPLQRYLAAGERARTLASLLHVDPCGAVFVAELVRRSGLPGRDWLRRLFGVLLPPLLHLLYRYGLAVNPHGENATVVYDANDVPVRVAVKDFVDDLKLLDEDLPEYADLPGDARGALIRADADELVESIVKAVLVGHFRYLAPLAEEALGVDEEEFWEMVRTEVVTYHRRFPELAERFARFDLLAPDFERVCLNRERLLGGGYHDRVERDAPFHLDAPRVPNPLHHAPGLVEGDLHPDLTVEGDLHPESRHR